MRTLCLLACLSLSAFGQNAPGFSLGSLDKSADPCVNFYQYACGNWMVKHPIPGDQSRWGAMDVLQEHNKAALQNILEKAAVSKPNRAPVEQKIGDFYASCMDSQAIDKLGLKPLESELARIQAISSKPELLPEIARLHLQGVNVLFNFSSAPDAKDSMSVIAWADQGGLGLPDRDYYLKDEPRFVDLRTKYVSHVAKLMELSGEPGEKAASDAQAILHFETELAKGAMDRVARRDPNNTFHKLTVHELVSLCPIIDWPKYFTAVDAPPMKDLNIVVPNFYRTLESALVQTDLETIKTYLRWHLIHAEVAFLPTPFVEENFKFFSAALTGAKEQKPRWKRCVEAVDNDLGFALGQKYVDETFGAEGKARTLKMVDDIEKALNQDIQTLSWMTPATKKEALVKLHAVANKIGYPDKQRDYSSVNIVRGEAIGNDFRATEFEVHRTLKKIGTTVDRAEWFMTPPTVNAYYNPTENNINFPAGILQPPFFDRTIDNAVNYGSIGAVVGHELTHGFDDQGRQFDPQGNLKDWWSKEDADEFKKRAECFINEYSSFTPLPDLHLNGKLTLGENTADNGGVRLAFMALMSALKEKPQENLDGFTSEQRFFLGYGQVWCQNITPEGARLRVQIDPHSPGPNRVNGVVQNMPEFQKAFACKVGQPMVAAPACRVW